LWSTSPRANTNFTCNGLLPYLALYRVLFFIVLGVEPRASYMLRQAIYHWSLVLPPLFHFILRQGFAM
jgi:hypothetical protein